MAYLPRLVANGQRRDSSLTTEQGERSNFPSTESFQSKKKKIILSVEIIPRRFKLQLFQNSLQIVLISVFSVYSGLFSHISIRLLYHQSDKKHHFYPIFPKNKDIVFIYLHTYMHG